MQGESTGACDCEYAVCGLDIDQVQGRSGLRLEFGCRWHYFSVASCRFAEPRERKVNEISDLACECSQYNSQRTIHSNRGVYAREAGYGGNDRCNQNRPRVLSRCGTGM